MQYHLKKLSNSTLKIDGLQTTFKIITWFTRGQYFFSSKDTKLKMYHYFLYLLKFYFLLNVM